MYIPLCSEVFEQFEREARSRKSEKCSISPKSRLLVPLIEDCSHSSSSTSSKEEQIGKKKSPATGPRPGAAWFPNGTNSDPQSAANDEPRLDYNVVRHGLTQARKEIEVAPGTYLPLIGSAETLNAVRNGQITRGDCFVCGVPLYCVEYASHVLCPLCRTVSPIGSPLQVQVERNCPVNDSGVGLGMTENDYYSVFQPTRHLVQSICPEA